MIRNSVRLLTTFLTVCLFAGGLRAADGLHEINLSSLHDLVYDSFTAKLYGTRANALLQIDPESGTILQQFVLGGNPGRMVLDSRRRLWIGLDATCAVLIFNLETLSTEDKIDLRPSAAGIFPIQDISPSLGDPATIVVSLRKDIYGRAYLVRRGAALPDTVLASNLALAGSYVFAETPDGIYRYPVQSTGIIPGPRVGSPTFNSARQPFNVANLIVQGTRVYHSSGEEFDFVSGETIQDFPSYPASCVALSKDEDALYYLFHTPPSIQRFARTSRLHTGQIDLPTDAGQHLTVWSTNRAAFHTSDKLYILETDKLNPPADLEVQVSLSPANAAFGDILSYAILVTNKGPAAALDLSLVVNIAPDGLIISPAQNAGRALTNLLPNLPPNSSKVLASFSVLPLGAGVLTNRFSVASGSADPNPANNTVLSLVPIAPANPTAPVLRFKFAAPTIAVDPFHERFVLSAANHLLVYDPRREKFSATVPIGSNARQLAFSPSEPFMFLSYGTTPGGLTRLNSETFEVTGLPAVPQPLGTISDIAVSPALTGLPGNPYVAISDSGALHFSNGSVPARPGFIQFSEDGSRLYHLNLDTCALNTFRATTNILNPVPFDLLSTQPDLDCSDFRVRDGLLYFESGLIYNPSTGQTVGRVPGLSLLSFVLPGDDGLLNVLARANGLWRVRRLNATNFQEVASIEIGSLPSSESPQETVILGNKLAFRTATSVYLVSLDPLLNPSELQLAAFQTAPGEIALRFTSAQGATYRIEQSSQIAPANWSTLQDNLTGTGLTLEIKVPTSGKITFYRLVKN